MSGTAMEVSAGKMKKKGRAGKPLGLAWGRGHVIWLCRVWFIELMNHYPHTPESVYTL